MPAGSAFSVGALSLGARSGNTVNIERRVTGGLPLRTATRFVVPIDNPNGSYIKRIPCVVSGRRPAFTISVVGADQGQTHRGWNPVDAVVSPKRDSGRALTLRSPRKSSSSHHGGRRMNSDHGER